MHFQEIYIKISRSCRVQCVYVYACVCVFLFNLRVEREIYEDCIFVYILLSLSVLVPLRGVRETLFSPETLYVLEKFTDMRNKPAGPNLIEEAIFFF